MAAARDLFGDLWRSRILELNASDERGIAVVRDKIKTFAQQTVSSSSNAKIPPFKVETIVIIFLILCSILIVDVVIDLDCHLG